MIIMLRVKCLVNCSANIKYSSFTINPFKKLKCERSVLNCQGMKKSELNKLGNINQSLCMSTKPQLKIVKVYRWDPEEQESKPYLQKFEVDLNLSGRRVLDILNYIKSNYDATVSFRQSCNEGVCGTCSMNINGVNTLACITKASKDLSEPLIIYPLPHTYVIRDLVSDMTHFLDQYKIIEPYLKRPGEEEFIGTRSLLQSQNDRSKMSGLHECILCACCTYSCPPYWWSGEKYLGPAVLMQVYRWVIDSRDLTENERLCKIRDYFSIFRCTMIFNCTKSCPKGLNPAKAIAELKGMIAGLKKKEKPEIESPVPAACIKEAVISKRN